MDDSRRSAFGGILKPKIPRYEIYKFQTQHNEIMKETLV